MRNRNLVLGMGAALLVAVAVVAVGSYASGGSGGSTPTAQQSLPPGHPSVSGTTAGSTTSPSTKQSISELRQASKKDPGNVAVLLQLGNDYFLAQEYTQAEKTFRQALRIKPGDPTATVRLAMVWQANGDTQRAMQAIQGVLRRAPNDQEAHYSMAIVYFSLERVQQARDEWAKAAQLDPTSVLGRRSQNFVDLIDGKQTSQPSQSGN